MNATLKVEPAFDALIFSDRNPAQRIASALRWLVDVPVNGFSEQQNRLLSKLPLNRIRSFGEVEVINYVESLDHKQRREIVEAMVQLRCLEINS